MTDCLDQRFDWSRPDLVAVYDELPLWSAMFGLVLLQDVPLRPATALLDVGCGTGFPLLELAERLGPSCTAVGLDPWTQALRRASAKIRLRGIHSATVVEGDAAAMPFADRRFDLIVSNVGINNFPDPEAAFAECRRVAKPNATLALTTNLRGHMRELYQAFEATLKELGKDERLPRLMAHIEHRATVAKTAALLAEAGFAVRKVRQGTLPMRFLDGGALLRHSFIRIGFLDGWRSIVGPAEEPALFRTLAAHLTHLAQAQGELRLTIPFAYVEAERTP